jgi:hypothetical protein
MKTKRVVIPSETQRIVLNLEPEELGAGRVEVDIILLSNVRRDEVSQAGDGRNRLYIS